MSEPEVSIITACFNARAYIESTLQSVLSQTGPALEYIVVDGGSTDGTLDILRRYQDRIRLISEPDRGQADALNKGLRLVRGEFVGWLNADDTYEPGSVEAGCQALRQDTQAGLVFADCHYINGQDQVVGRWQTRPTVLADLLLDGCTIAHQAAFLRRSLFDRVGAFDAGLHYVMDYDLLLRGLIAFPARRVEGTWGNLRVWEGTKTTQHPLDFWPEVLRMLETLRSGRQIDADLGAEALRRAHFRYGLEAAWTGDHSAAQRELVAACRSGAPYGSWAQAAEHTVTFCRQPSYLSVEPAEANRLLGLVAQEARVIPPLASHLQMVSAFIAVQAGDWTTAGRHARAALRQSAAARRNRGLWAVWAKSAAYGAVGRFGPRGSDSTPARNSPLSPPGRS